MMREVIAGITTFFTMAYIIIVNPTILSTPGTGMPFTGVLTATVLVCSTMTLLMGLYAKLPFGVAPGMGLNAFFTYTIVLQGGVPWPVARGIVFWAGVLFLLVSATPLRETIALAIPPSLRFATAAGIGLLLTFIGLQNAGFVADNPATLVGVGRLDHRALVTLLGLAVAVWLTRRGNPLAFLGSIFICTAVAWIAGWVTPPASWLSAPDFSSVFLELDVLGALKIALLPAIVTVMMTDLFDSLSTFIGVAQAARMLDEDGRPKNLRRGLIVDSLATLSAGLAGSSPRHGVRRKHRGHSHGRTNGRHGCGHGPLFRAVSLHRAACGRRTAVRHSGRVDQGWRRDVSNGGADSIRSSRRSGSCLRDARADSAHVLDHAGYAVGIRPARGASCPFRPRA